MSRAKRVVTTVRMPADLLKQAKEFTSQGYSLNSLICDSLREYCDELKRETIDAAFREGQEVRNANR
jgi:hypothetical protein